MSSDLDFVIEKSVVEQKNDQNHQDQDFRLKTLFAHVYK